MEWLNKQAKSFDRVRFGAMSAMIIFQSCLGSVAALLGIYNDLWSIVSIAAILSMGSNTLFIAQQSAKLCIIGFYISVIINALLITVLLIV